MDREATAQKTKMKEETMENNEATGMKFNIDHDPQTRKGVHANITIASTNGPVTRLDFISTDLPDDNGTMRGILSARVYMTNENLIALRNMLNDHTEKWTVENNDAAHGE